MRARLSPWLLPALLAVAGHANAQDADPPTLSIELNGAETTERGCRLTFVAANRLDEDIARAAYEVALFGTDGLVKSLTVLDFKALPAGETKVRQFDLPTIDCAALGRVLVNGTTACDGPAEAAACMGRLEATTRGAVVFGK